MEKKRPTHLTRFYGNIDYALEVLTQRQVTFIHADKLNDPFDPYFFFETDFDKDYKTLLRHISDHHPSDLSWFVRQVPARTWLEAARDLENKLKDWREHVFVLSLCGEQQGTHPKDNLYMWGHYGNGHRGVAIEFDTNVLGQSIVDENKKAKGVPVEAEQIWADMQYEDKLPPLTCAMFFEFFKAEYERDRHNKKTAPRTALDAYYELLPRIKNKCWERENEWRLMWSNTETDAKIHKCFIDESSIQAVYIGLCVPQEMQEKVTAEVRLNFPQAKIYQAKKRHGDIALDFEPTPP